MKSKHLLVVLYTLILTFINCQRHNGTQLMIIPSNEISLWTINLWTVETTSDKHLYATFIPMENDCWHPNLTVKFEEIDLSQIGEYINIYGNNESEIGSECGIASVCSSWEYCVNESSLFVEQISIEQEYKIHVYGTSEINVPCNGRTMNVNVTIACGILPTIQPTIEPTVEPSILPTVFPTELPTDIIAIVVNYNIKCSLNMLGIDNSSANQIIVDTNLHVYIANATKYAVFDQITSYQYISNNYTWNDFTVILKNASVKHSTYDFIELKLEIDTLNSILWETANSELIKDAPEIAAYVKQQLLLYFADTSVIPSYVNISTSSLSIAIIDIKASNDAPTTTEAIMDDDNDSSQNGSYINQNMMYIIIIGGVLVCVLLCVLCAALYFMRVKHKEKQLSTLATNIQVVTSRSPSPASNMVSLGADPPTILSAISSTLTTATNDQSGTYYRGSSGGSLRHNSRSAVVQGNHSPHPPARISQQMQSQVIQTLNTHSTQAAMMQQAYLRTAGDNSFDTGIQRGSIDSAIAAVVIDVRHDELMENAAAFIDLPEERIEDEDDDQLQQMELPKQPQPQMRETLGNDIDDEEDEYDEQQIQNTMSTKTESNLYLDSEHMITMQTTGGGFSVDRDSDDEDSDDDSTETDSDEEELYEI